MKKLLLGLFIAGSVQASNVVLFVGESISLGSDTVSCVARTNSSGNQSSCAIARTMSKQELYTRARSTGLGGCFIFNNGDYYGVIDNSGSQISMTYHCPDANGGYCEAPVKGLIQLACELKKCRD